MSQGDATFATGLAMLAVVAGAAYVYGRWLPYQYTWLAPFAAADLAASFGYGVWRSASVRPSRRLGAGLVWAALFALLLATPAAIRTGQLSAASLRVEPPPGSRLVRRTLATVVGYDGRPGFRLVFDVAGKWVGNRYFDLLEANGWRPVEWTWEQLPNPVPDGDLPGDVVSGGSSLAFRWLERGTDRITVSVLSVGHLRIVVDGPPGPDKPPDLPW